ncbi:hypothetical protein [Paenibacillus wynnii]|uniref:Uncharacterized protein n=1 Tax=Paenibacillus wynnii TaxID=268407 RepID=A0A098MDD6_9BACL|nr:hypothetical protein [Paenibacillus wynnii]KGE20585.1 hypothetical protein PWYN_15455 [Paenibacillus wynnii]
MKLSINLLRNIMALFLTLKDRAEMEGETKTAEWAEKQYRAYHDLYLQALENEKRPAGLGAGRPSLSFKIIIKTRLTSYEDKRNVKCS